MANPPLGFPTIAVVHGINLTSQILYSLSHEKFPYACENIPQYFPISPPLFSQGNTVPWTRWLLCCKCSLLKKFPKLAALPSFAQCYTHIPPPLHATTLVTCGVIKSYLKKSRYIDVCSEVPLDYAKSKLKRSLLYTMHLKKLHTHQNLNPYILHPYMCLYAYI